MRLVYDNHTKIVSKIKTILETRSNPFSLILHPITGKRSLRCFINTLKSSGWPKPCRVSPAALKPQHVRPTVQLRLGCDLSSAWLTYVPSSPGPGAF